MDIEEIIASEARKLVDEQHGSAEANPRNRVIVEGQITHERELKRYNAFFSKITTINPPIWVLIEVKLL